MEQKKRILFLYAYMGKGYQLLDRSYSNLKRNYKDIQSTLQEKVKKAISMN